MAIYKDTLDCYKISKARGQGGGSVVLTVTGYAEEGKQYLIIRQGRGFYVEELTDTGYTLSEPIEEHRYPEGIIMRIGQPEKNKEELEKLKKKNMEIIEEARKELIERGIIKEMPKMTLDESKKVNVIDMMFGDEKERFKEERPKEEVKTSEFKKKTFVIHKKTE